MKTQAEMHEEARVSHSRVDPKGGERALTAGLPLLLSVPEVCEVLKIGRTSLYQVLDKELPEGLPVVRIGRSVRVHVDDLYEFSERLRRPHDARDSDREGNRGR